jgi:hypothetical protein
MIHSISSLPAISVAARSRSYFTTDGQSMSWCRAHSESCCLCLYGAPSLTRGRVCNLRYTVSSETPQTWSARFPYLYPPGTGWPSYTPGHWVLRLTRLWWRYSTPPKHLSYCCGLLRSNMKASLSSNGLVHYWRVR